MKTIMFDGTTWTGYGVISYTDRLEKESRIKFGASLGFQISGFDGMTFLQEPVEGILNVVCSVRQSEYQIILTIKGKMGWDEKYFNKNDMTDIKIYEF